jgi:hypothetical protein
MKAACVRAIVGAAAGVVIGFLAGCLLHGGEPPVSATVLLAATGLGAALGSVVGATAGGRSVPVFWLYLVLIFGGITVLPFWYYGKTDTYLPLGTVYVNSPQAAVIPFVLLPHLAVSVGLAALAAVLHRRLAVPADDDGTGPSASSTGRDQP